MRIVYTILMLCIFSTASLAQKINSAASVVSFSVSNMKVRTVDGTLKGLKGDLSFDKNNVEQANFNVSVDVNTIETGIEKRDKHLKKDDFFDVEKYPTIKFKSNSVKKTSSGYSTTGTITIKDVSKKITIPFKVLDSTLTGNFSIKRKEYNVGVGTSNFMVGEDIDIVIKCVLE